jgi:hypothetical protein
VPITVNALVCAIVSSGRAHLEALDQPEVHHLGHVGDAAALAENDVGGLDVAVDQAHVVRLGQRAADLLEDVGNAGGRLRPVDVHQLLQVDAVQVLHRVVEHAVGRAAVVEDQPWSPRPRSRSPRPRPGATVFPGGAGTPRPRRGSWAPSTRR